MGCCQSTECSSPLNPGLNSSNALASNLHKGKKAHEEKIELAFKAKRANIYTVGIDIERERDTFVQKRVFKTPKQAKTISQFNLLLLQLFNCLIATLI
jgi:hypothetical protein